MAEDLRLAAEISKETPNLLEGLMTHRYLCIGTEIGKIGNAPANTDRKLNP